MKRHRVGSIMAFRRRTPRRRRPFARQCRASSSTDRIITRTAVRRCRVSLKRSPELVFLSITIDGIFNKFLVRLENEIETKNWGGGTNSTRISFCFGFFPVPHSSPRPARERPNKSAAF